MQIGIREVIIYSIFGLTIALAVNYYGDLNIPVINKVQSVLIPGIDDGDPEDEFSYSSRGAISGCEASKTFGDAKRMLRRHIKSAQASGNQQLELDLKQRFADIKEKERQACL